jgi:uncharacterized membrane protein
MQSGDGMTEREHRYVHRLEAFSDIVIGFSLAQLGLSLTLPPHVAYVLTHPYGLIAFAFTFVIVVGIWISHHRLFDRYFIPRRVTVLLNFVVLAFTLLLVYMVQVYTRFAPSKTEHQLAALLYFSVFSITYTLLGLLYVLSMRLRWKTLSGADRADGVGIAARISGVGLGLAIGLILLEATREPVDWAPFFIIAFVVGLRLAVQPLVRRLTLQQNTAAST